MFKKKYIKWSLVVIWMIVIFLFSSQPANESNENNRFLVTILNYIGIDLNSFFGVLTDFVVRKAAHLTEYFILYILIYNALKSEIWEFKSLALALLLIFLYACTDEIHQLYVPGRAGMIRDVLIDTSSGVIYIAGYFIVMLKKSSTRKKKLLTRR